ncbi:TPA: hypothetical protein RXJ19_004622, partial [Escherichia coli]|nr:hypothetical protein [Escherichia coli]
MKGAPASGRCVDYWRAPTYMTMVFVVLLTLLLALPQAVLMVAISLAGVIFVPP